MKLIPNVKKITESEGCFDAKSFCWSFIGDVDKRVVAAAQRISDGNNSSNVISISHRDNDSEGYTIKIEPSNVAIVGEGAAGAFYALSTLKLMLKKFDNSLPCCEIEDYPDMKIRGFYQDTTRGRVPSIETLKSLVDTMTDYKLNMLQLYVEHSFDFKEYDFCKEELGYLTADEIKELDIYCKDRFIDLVPSLATFGHLYHLLQSDRYGHLAEIKDYKPKLHHYWERMKHHTINPLLDESFELITSLIDQHMEAFTSEYFNICGDETFDLGTDVNKGKDKGKLYVDFITKLVRYVESKGKKVMMWGDVALQYPESIVNLPDSIIYLNWNYEKNPDENNVKALADKNQLVCPGTCSWIGFSERIGQGVENIEKFAKMGKKYNAMGVLNTNWGDMGNLASIPMAMFGTIFGAVVSWDNNFTLSDGYKEFVAKYYYGTYTAVEALEFFSEIQPISSWTRLWSRVIAGNSTGENVSQEIYENAILKCERIIDKIKESDFITENMKREFLVAAKGYALLLKWCAKSYGFDVKTNVDFEKWLSDYEEIWMIGSKKSELDTLKERFLYFNSL